MWIKTKNELLPIGCGGFYVRVSGKQVKLTSLNIDEEYVAGDYKTEERAYEVLNEIQDRIENYEENKISDTIYATNHLLPIFEMPKE